MGSIAAIIADWGRSKRFSLREPPQWFIDWAVGGASSSGVEVTHSSALKHSPFWAAVRIISGTLASLPIKVYERLENGGKRPVTSHQVYPLVHGRPNDYMDWVTFAETRQAHVLCYGNGYAEIQRDGGGRPVALWPLLPTRTSRKLSPDGVPYYEVRLETNEVVQLPDYDVLHIKGLGFDGYTGYDVVSYHKEAIGYGVAVKQYGSRFFANDANPGGYLEHPGQLGPTARKNLQESMEREHTGLTNAHRLMILEEGMKWSKVGVDPEAAQAIEAQKFTVDDCARIFQIPPHKIASMEFSKYANVYDLNNDFYCSTMLYWFRKWEQEINYKLFMTGERSTMFAEILADALLRGNLEARTAFYGSARQWGYLSINDIRSKENLNPIGPEGDVYLDPLNMAPAGTLQPPKEGSKQPKPDEPDDSPDEPDDSPDEPEDQVRKAHTDLLIAQLRRVLIKQENSCRNRQPDSAWWDQHRRWTCNVLDKPVIAYAATRGLAEDKARDRLRSLIGEWIVDGSHLDPNNWADIIAMDIICRIGGNHAVRK